MAVVTDQNDRVAVLSKLDRLAVDLRNQRAGSVNRLQLALGRLGVNRRRDAVRREDGDSAFRDRVVQLIDEDRASVAELLDDVLIVDDLLAHLNGRAVGFERALDRLDGAVNSGAVAARGGKQDLLGGVH